MLGRRRGVPFNQIITLLGLWTVTLLWRKNISTGHTKLSPSSTVECDNPLSLRPTSTNCHSKPTFLLTLNNCRFYLELLIHVQSTYFSSTTVVSRSNFLLRFVGPHNLRTNIFLYWLCYLTRHFHFVPGWDLPETQYDSSTLRIELPLHTKSCLW